LETNLYSRNVATGLEAEMKVVRKRLNSACLLMAALMLWIATPCQSVLAAMISTDLVVEPEKALKARAYLENVISRADVQQYLTAQGVDPIEAKARIDSLSDAEVVQLADKIERLPAGGSAVGVIVGAILIVFLVLLITDILGFTHVFPFVKHKR
jgi:uncharacterized membrane protein